MVNMLRTWYQRHFSDPDNVALLAIIVGSFLFIYFFSSLLMPVLVSIAIAYLLEWPVFKLNQVGFSRMTSTALVLIAFIGFSLIAMLGLMPLVWQQGTNLVQEIPHMLTELQTFLLTLPDKYPEVFNPQQIEEVLTLVNDKMFEWGQVVIQASLNSISDIVALLIYLILVPLMVFFFLKDKKELQKSVVKFLPKERRLASQVGDEMNQQIMNYIRGKVIEILIVGTVSVIAFAMLDLRYSLLLGVLVGLSVLVPYVGATIVTFPVMLVALFQFGIGSEFGYVMLAYGIIQALDGNLLVPLLFSEAVNLHPVVIIIAVIFFGGLWGFWGVFFAIPLATLVKAIINAWSSSQQQEPEQV